MSLPYHAEIVKEQDPDRFLMAALMPDYARNDLLALFAFNHEIAKTSEVVSEPMLGQIRLKWWLEHIEGIYKTGQSVRHEVLEPLARTIQQYDLPFAEFETLIMARSKDLEEGAFDTIDDFRAYCVDTNAPLLRLGQKIIETGNPSPDNSLPVSSPVFAQEEGEQTAMNYSLSGLFRAVPFYAGLNRCIFPKDKMEAQSYSLADYYGGKNIEGLVRVTEDLIRTLYRPVKRPPGLLHKAMENLGTIYMRQIIKCRYNPVHPGVQMEPPLKALRLLIKYYIF